MESLRLICDTEIPINQQKMDSVAVSFSLSLDSIKAKAQQTVQNQARLAKMKADLRDAEDELVKVLSVKTRKEAKQMAMRDSISAAKARIVEVKRTVEIRRARRDEYRAIISKQSLALATSEEKTKQDLEHKGEIEEAIS
ncbi:putative Kinetochore protein spc25, partial [Melia azedarach]